MNEKAKDSPLQPCRLFFPAVVILLALTITANSCSTFSGESKRKEHLESAVKRFHLLMVSREIPSLLVQLPREDRRKWAEVFLCYFDSYRIVDYSVQEVEYGEEAKDAEIMVWMTIHAVDSITTREMLWIEEWKHDVKGWRLDPEADDFRGYMGACYR